MIKHYCDRCSEEIEDNSYQIYFATPSGKKIQSFFGERDEFAEKRKTVCDKCFVAIYNLFPSERKEKTKWKN